MIKCDLMISCDPQLEVETENNILLPLLSILVSIVVSIPACHAGDRGSIPRRGDSIFLPCSSDPFEVLSDRIHSVMLGTTCRDTVHSSTSSLKSFVEQSGAVEACWVHNPEVRRSKLRSANCFFFSSRPSA